MAIHTSSCQYFSRESPKIRVVISLLCADLSTWLSSIVQSGPRKAPKIPRYGSNIHIDTITAWDGCFFFFLRLSSCSSTSATHRPRQPRTHEGQFDPVLEFADIFVGARQENIPMRNGEPFGLEAVFQEMKISSSREVQSKQVFH